MAARLTLTGDGETFLVYARLLQLQREAIAALGRSRPVTLRFGIPEDYADTWLPALLERFGAASRRPRAYPLPHVDGTAGTIGERLAGYRAGGAARRGQEAACGHGGRGLGGASAFCADPGRPILALFPGSAFTGCWLRWPASVATGSSTPPVKSEGLRVIVNQGQMTDRDDRRRCPRTGERWGKRRPAVPPPP